MNDTAYIKCDNSPCDFIEYMDKIDPVIWLNKPCPKCSSNLLSEDDYIAYVKYQQAVAAMERLDPSKLSELEDLAIDVLEKSGIDTDDVDASIDISFHDGIKISQHKE